MRILSDTIAARATPTGIGGIAVIRVSGPQALAVADRLFQGARRPSAMKGYSLAHGFIRDPASGELVDEVLLAVFRAPRSYTGEDMIEIAGHGGAACCQAVLSLLLHSGVRMAQPGEFTRRALLNGRIDLNQAEAIRELAEAETEATRRRALRQLLGNFSRRIDTLRNSLMTLIADLTARAEFGEEVPVSTLQLNRRLWRLCKQLTDLVTEAETSRLVRDGALVVIVGRTNVGKSSLFNRLLDEERAIVTDIPGTTRDCIEARLRLGDFVIRLVDTAGWHTRPGRIEALSRLRAQEYVSRADLLIVVLDRSSQLKREDNHILGATRQRRRIIILNKCDLPNRLQLSRCDLTAPVLFVSARNGTGIARLRQLLRRSVLTGSYNGDFIATERTSTALRRAAEACQLAATSKNLDVRLLELTNAARALEELAGKITTDEILDAVFSRFCVGK